MPADSRLPFASSASGRSRIFERVPGQLGQRLRAPRQTLQLPVRHAGIVVRQPPPFSLIVQVGFVQVWHSPSILRLRIIANCFVNRMGERISYEPPSAHSEWVRECPRTISSRTGTALTSMITLT